MEKQVLVHVSGLHMMEGDGQEEPVEIVVPGEHYFRNGSHYVRYEEMLDDSNKPTVNYIKISSKGMEVRKKGLVNTHMVFEQGKKNVAFYTTPFGTLQMGIAATNLEFKEKEEKFVHGSCKIRYTSIINYGSCLGWNGKYGTFVSIP